jgi:hypothetical protein
VPAMFGSGLLTSGVTLSGFLAQPSLTVTGSVERVYDVVSFCAAILQCHHDCSDGAEAGVPILRFQRPPPLVQRAT